MIGLKHEILDHADVINSLSNACNEESTNFDYKDYIKSKKGICQDKCFK